MTCVLLVVVVGYFNIHYVVTVKLFRDTGRFLDMLLLKFCEHAFKADGNTF